MLALHTDSCNVRGKLLLSIFPSASGIYNVLRLSPQYMGDRPATMTGLFSHWRFKYLNFRVYASTQNGAVNQSNIMAIGVLDDASGAEGDAPTTLNGVMALRTSKYVPYGLAPASREYKPPTSDWYYTYTGASGSDPRLVNCGVLFAAVTGASAIDVEVDYSISFKGAVDTGSGLSLTQRTDDYVSIQPVPRSIPVMSRHASTR